MGARATAARAASPRDRRQHRRPLSQIPTAGMADIAFLLLIFFMVIVFEADRTRVDLPETMTRSTLDGTAALVVLARGGDGAVLVRFAGDVTEESRLLPDLDALDSEAAWILSRHPGRVFKIKADGAIPARTVTRVFDALTQAGARQVLLLTDQRSAGGGEAT